MAPWLTHSKACPKYKSRNTDGSDNRDGDTIDGDTLSLSAQLATATPWPNPAAIRWVITQSGRVGFHDWAVREPHELSVVAQRVYGAWVVEQFTSIYPEEMIERANTPREAGSEDEDEDEDDAAANPAGLAFSRRGGELSEDLLRAPPSRSSLNGRPGWLIDFL